jgi:hypothetical protein
MLAGGSMNTPVIDPTKNVLEHVAAAIKRQDDLRDAHLQLIIARFDGLSRLTEEKIEHARSVIRLRSEYTQLLRDAEAQRLDANRQFDQLAVTRATDAANLAIQAVAASHEASARVVEARLAVIERAIYEGKGKDTGASDNTKMIFGTLSAIMTLISIGSFVYAMTK